MSHLQQAFDGTLDPAKVETLVPRIEARLRKRYPEQYLPEPAQPPVVGAEFVEKSMAISLWQKIEKMPFEQQCSVIRRQVAFSTPELYRLLCQKSVDAGQVDAERGIVIARLIPASIPAIAEQVGDLLPGLWTQAWSIRGYCQQMARDFAAAEESFDLAQQQIDSLTPDLTPYFLMYLCLFRAMLRIKQKRYTECYYDLKVVAFILDNPDPEKYRREREAERLAEAGAADEQE